MIYVKNLDQDLDHFLHHLPEAYAYHQVVTNESGDPVDYLFLRANPAFEAMTGLKADDIIGQRVTEVLPGIESGDFDWIAAYGRVALTGEKEEFQQYSKPLDKWYSVTAYSDQPGYFAVLFRDITQWVEKEKKQAIASRVLTITSQVLDQIQDRVTVVDLQGTILYANRAQRGALELEVEDIVGESVDIYGNDYTKDITDQGIIEKTLEDGFWRGEVTNWTEDGKKRIGDLRTQVILDSEGNQMAIAGITTDITEAKKDKAKLQEYASMLEMKNKELEYTGEKAKAACLAKDQFLANMSHEIRTPMNGILGFLQLLEETDTDPKQSEYIDYIKNSSETLLVLINDILDLSKIESGKMELEHISYDLRSTIEKTVIPHKHRARSKNVELILNIHPGFPQQVKGDPIRLKQILTNLLDNAVKFTEAGHITVECRAKEEAGNQAVIQLEIKDAGVGIPVEAQESIFQSFTQVDASTTREYGGSGLGLAITKDLVRLMKGSIEVQSTPGQGSTFMVSLPMEKEGNSVNPETASDFEDEREKESAVRKEISILMAEDQAINRALMFHLLQNIGMECDIAENGQEAVEACKKKAYDLVLMDIQMPVMNGLEATRQIRQLPEIHQPKIAAMTARAMKEDKAKCLDTGMDAYLTKPINVDQLMELLQ